MARKQPPRPPASNTPFWITAIGFFLAQIAVLPGAASAFRLPKEATVISALCLALGVWVWAAARRREITLPSGRIVLLLVLYPLVLLISSAWSASPQRAIASSALTAVWVLGILWMSTLDTDQRRRLTLAAALGAAVSVAVMLLQLAGIPVFAFTAQFASGRFRLSGLTGNPADLAMAAVLLLPLLLVLAEDPRHRRLCAGLAIFLSLAVLITQTLTGIAALNAVILVWLIHHRSKKLWVGAVVLAVLLVVVALPAGLGKRIAREAQRVQKGNWYLLLSARGDGWTAATEMVRSQPIAGVGAANYTHQFFPSRVAWLTRNGGTGRRQELSSHFDWAHNDPLQLAAEIGVPGILWAAALGWAIVSVRRRAGPLLPLAFAAWLPFALLHYPDHLTVGLIPIALVLAHLVAAAADPQTIPWTAGRTPLTLVVMVIALMTCYWQLQRVAASLWMGGLETRLAFAARAEPEVTARRASAVEAQALPRTTTLKSHAPVLWRTIGRSRVLRNDWAGAETAFRNAHSLWPHEESALYLGLSLVAQGRRSEGLQLLGQVCRTNPALVRLISSDEIRRTVEDMLEAYRRR